MNTPTAKRRFVEYSKRDGNPRITYAVTDGEFIKYISPRAFQHLPLPDTTPESTLETAATLRYKAERKRFGDQIEDSRWLRENPVPDSARYRALCARAGIKY